MAMPDLDLDTRRPIEALPAWVGVVEKAKRGWQATLDNLFFDRVYYIPFMKRQPGQRVSASDAGDGD